MKQWTIQLLAEVPDEMDAEHIRSGTEEAMRELDFWTVRVLATAEVGPAGGKPCGSSSA